MNNSLKGKVALVTGASRGVGRGIALGLCEYGATVYVTGRNNKSLNETSLMAEKNGGVCIPLVCDHSDDSETLKVYKLIEDQGKALNLLINNAWGGYETMVENGKFTWNDDFWDQPTWRWDKIFTVGVRTVFLNSKYAVRNMLTLNEGLIVNISYWAAQKHIANILYGASKACVDKLTSDMAFELKDKNITVVSLYPGLVRTEEVMKNSQLFDLSNSESPQFLGRVIAELYSDKRRMQRSGHICIASQLALEYGISDIDGKQPRPLSITDV